MKPKYVTIPSTERECLNRFEQMQFEMVFVWNDPHWLYYPTVHNKTIVLRIINSLLSDYNAADETPTAQARHQMTKRLIELMADTNYRTNQ